MVSHETVGVGSVDMYRRVILCEEWQGILVRASEELTPESI